jgi:hypothetical protein
MNQDQNAVSTSATFNVGDFEASDTAWLEVQNKKDDGPLMSNGAPVRILVRSPGTKEAISAQHRIDLAATNRMYAAMRGKQVNETVESKTETSVSKLLAVTGEIQNFPISPKELYSNPKLGYITEQVTKFHGDWANF